MTELIDGWLSPVREAPYIAERDGKYMELKYVSLHPLPSGIDKSRQLQVIQGDIQNVIRALKKNCFPHWPGTKVTLLRGKYKGYNAEIVNLHIDSFRGGAVLAEVNILRKDGKGYISKDYYSHGDSRSLYPLHSLEFHDDHP